MTKRIEFDGNNYDYESLSDAAKSLVSSLRIVDAKLVELQAFLAVMLRAKHGYMSDLKAEIVKSKTGVDLGDLFLD